MDSYNFHFERMSNIDLHPLSLPVSRLSPAKSSSSIVDQFAHHHQHGKGDSAYSSFSGGSTAPDYPSPFLPDDLQSSSFSHYADLKYVRSFYNPSQVLQSDPKTMDQLYRSVEAISQQYRHSNNNLHHYNGSESVCNNNNKALSKQEVPSQGGYITHHPPPIPARLDSFIATKNLENTRGHQHGGESPPQQPQPQAARHQTHSQQHLETTKSDMSHKTEVYDSWRGPQQQQPQSYRPHLQSQEQPITQMNPEYLSISTNIKAEQKKTMKTLSQSPPRGANQAEHLTPKHPPNSHGDQQVKNSRNSLEGQRRRAHSAHDVLECDSNRMSSAWSGGQNVFNSSIQHKGQFYFVTGVCKNTSHSGMGTHSPSVCGSETGSELGTYKLRERCHSTMENLFRPFQESPRIFSDVIPDESHNGENHRPSHILTKSSRSLDALEEIDVTQSREIGRHTPNNPIFYCGPDRNSPKPLHMQTKEVSNVSSEQPRHSREEQAKRVSRQPLGDVASERINKETTPLLYHLTGANRAGFKPKSAETKSCHLDIINEPQAEPNKKEPMDVACNTLDDSYKKYYKEKLKDVQSRVLRETSFKRKDLQLSWPHRIRQKPDPRPTVIHSFSSSQDSEASTETLTPSVTSEETEKGSIKEEITIKNPRQTEKETEKESGRPANVAQPQVARIGGRKRLTAEQKKMCFSEPEKLNLLGGDPLNSSCRSFGNESENVFAVEQEVDEQLQQGEQGLVAARRKMFETRGRALSASSAFKTSLKHLQHKALVEYMVRKTGQKVAEPQQPAPQIPPPTRQRHSLGEKPFDWGHRPLSANQDSKKKKLNRPHSAGRILDSSTSSIRYAQFFSAQSSGQPHHPKLRESRGPSQGKSASVENLLDQPETHSFSRNRSTSTPHPFQGFDSEQDPLPVNNTLETCSPQKDPTEDGSVNAVAEGQQRIRVVAQRGKSMEELGASKLMRPSALSKSTEQLDQLWRHSTGSVERERKKRSVSSFVSEARDVTHEKERSKEWVSHEAVKNPDMTQETTQEQQNQTRKRFPVKQNSEPILGRKEADVGTRETNSSTSPSSSARLRLHSQGAVPNESRPIRPLSEASSNPPSPRGQDPNEREIKSTSSSPTQTKPPHEIRPSFRTRASPSASGSEIEQSVDKPTNDDAPSDSNQEVSLSCGVTTDPSLWLAAAEHQVKEDVPNPPLTDVFTDEPPNTVSLTQTSVSPSTSVSDVDVTRQQLNEEKNLQMEAEKLGETPDLEERGTPEGETESQDTPVEKPQWKELVVDVVKADQSLASVLYPLANRKTALMLMEQLLSEDTLLMEEHYKKKQEQRGAAESVEAVEIPETFSCPSSQTSEAQSRADIRDKKCLLVSYIEEHLRCLDETRGALQTEIEENGERGEALQALVRERCLPVELERYNLFIGDLERVVSLLLCLSARLARVQNALSTVDQHTDAEEKQSLDSRHRLLCKQRDDAKDLKDNLDRRESQVSAFLSRQLSAEQLHDYRRFVQTKASLLIRQKDLEEKQRLGEEQLEALSSSLNL